MQMCGRDIWVDLSMSSARKYMQTPHPEAEDGNIRIPAWRDELRVTCTTQVVLVEARLASFGDVTDDARVRGTVSIPASTRSSERVCALGGSINGLGVHFYNPRYEDS
jgi:hypothetical protein